LKLIEKEEEEPRFLAREEIRGLFTLGLLAVVTSIRIQNPSGISLIIDGKPYYITGLIDWMIFLWSFYAFFMILGLSDDIIGKKASKAFRRLSKYYLYFSYCWVALLAFAFYFSAYTTQAIGLSIFAVAVFLYWSAKQTYLFRKKVDKSEWSIRLLWKKSVNYLKSEWYQFLFSGFFLCFALAIAGTHEEFIIPSSIIGSIFLILFLVVRDRKKKTKKETSQKN
jgi:hypothetical protein